jgi:hypothetical protein
MGWHYVVLYLQDVGEKDGPVLRFADVLYQWGVRDTAILELGFKNIVAAKRCL